MDEVLIQTIRQKLMDKERGLSLELNQVAGKSLGGNVYQANFPDYGSDEDENSAEVATYTTNLSLEHQLAGALRDVRDALKRIEDGTYGICKYCNEQIDERRLLARPSSGACIRCKQEMKSRA